MGPKIEPKSMKNRGCVADAFLEPFGVALECQSGARQGFCRTLLGAIFDKKSKKGIQKSMRTSMPKKFRKMMPKGVKSDAKWHQQWSQNSIFSGKCDFEHLSPLSKRPQLPQFLF